MPSNERGRKVKVWPVTWIMDMGERGWSLHLPKQRNCLCIDWGFSLSPWASHRSRISCAGCYSMDYSLFRRTSGLCSFISVTSSRGNNSSSGSVTKWLLVETHWPSLVTGEVRVLLHILSCWLLVSADSELGGGCSAVVGHLPSMGGFCPQQPKNQTQTKKLIVFLYSRLLG